MRVDTAVTTKVMELRNRNAQRDMDTWRVRQVRSGNANLVAPAHFSEDWPHLLVANMLDAICRDLAESISPLPALNCASGSMRTDADKRRAGRKNRIGFNYWLASGLPVAMKTGADHYVEDGFLPFYVKLDFDKNLPLICVEDPYHCYYDLDEQRNTAVFVRVWRDRTARLARLFGEDVGRQLMFAPYGVGDTEVEVVRYSDLDRTVLYVPARQNLVLAEYPNVLPGRCPYVVAERPGGPRPRGYLDDIVWPQLARGVMAQLTMEAGKKSVQAPTVVPMDLVDLPIGPDSVWRTEAGAQSVAKVRLDVPREAFALTQELAQEMRDGARYPGVRSGTPEASVITGQGVKALNGTFDTQISEAQDVLGDALRRVTSMAFEADEKLWPDLEKTIDGTMAGETFHETYRARDAIASNYSCDVTYGFASGQSPAQALVMLQQLQGSGVLGVDDVRRNLPFPIDVEQVQRQIDVYEVRKAGIQGLQAAAAATGQMAAQGQDPSTLLVAMAKFIQGRQNGESVETLLERIFTPPPAPPEQPDQSQPGQPGQQPPGQPGQAPLPGQPGGPSIQQLISGMRSGQPVSNILTRQQTVAS